MEKHLHGAPCSPPFAAAAAAATATAAAAAVTGTNDRAARRLWRAEDEQERGALDGPPLAVSFPHEPHGFLAKLAGCLRRGYPKVSPPAAAAAVAGATAAAADGMGVLLVHFPSSPLLLLLLLCLL